MKVIIDGKVYEGHTLESVSIRDALAFNRDCAEHDYPWRWADVERIRNEIRLTKPTERYKHPEALVLTAVSVWASRLVAGDQVTFSEVIEAPLGTMRFVDDEPDPSKDKTGAAMPDPRPARPASGRAAAPRARKAAAPRQPAGSRKRT